MDEYPDKKSIITSFYSEEELKVLGLKIFGKNVLISRKLVFIIMEILKLVIM